MILKKPYGLLIKYFKLIHFILLLLTIYVAVNTKSIVNFFSDYVANNYYTNVYENIASDYITFFLYIGIFIVILMLIALFVLLRYKKKPTTFYLMAIVYYLFLLIMIFVASYLIGGLEKSLWETVAARQYRDFSQIIYWPQLIFVFILAIRTLGFDVKKFDFKKDIAELDLSEADSELIEINIGFDTTKLRRNLRRLIREFRYYFLENKFMIIIIIVLVGIFIGFRFKNNHQNLDNHYEQTTNFMLDGFNVNIKDSLITNLNYNGQVIDSGNYYFLVKLDINNTSGADKKLNYSNFKLYQDDKYYYPNLDLGNNFLDYGEPYFGSIIKKDSHKTYILPYKIPKDEITKDFNITIYNGTGLNNTTKNIYIKLSPVIIDNVSLVNSVKLGDELNLSGSYLNNTTLQVSNYTITNSYNYKYKTCEDCKEYTAYVTAKSDSTIKKTLLILDYKLVLDTTSEFYATNQSSQSFFSKFVRVNYFLNDQEYYASVEDVTPSVMQDKIILQVPDAIKDANTINLNITIRNKSYMINLKKQA